MGTIYFFVTGCLGSFCTQPISNTVGSDVFNSKSHCPCMQQRLTALWAGVCSRLCFHPESCLRWLQSPCTLAEKESSANEWSEPRNCGWVMGRTTLLSGGECTGRCQGPGTEAILSSDERKKDRAAEWDQHRGKPARIQNSESSKVTQQDKPEDSPVNDSWRLQRCWESSALPQEHRCDRRMGAKWQHHSKEVPGTWLFAVLHYSLSCPHHVSGLAVSQHSCQPWYCHHSGVRLN